MLEWSWKGYIRASHGAETKKGYSCQTQREEASQKAGCGFGPVSCHPKIRAGNSVSLCYSAARVHLNIYRAESHLRQSDRSLYQVLTTHDAPQTPIARNMARSSARTTSCRNTESDFPAEGPSAERYAGILPSLV